MTFGIVVLIVLVVLLVLLAGVVIAPGEHSLFELRRRQEGGDKTAAAELKREAVLADLASLKRVVETLLVVAVAAVSVAFFGWLVGIILAVVVALEYGALARLPLLRRFAARQYARIEPKLIDFASRYHKPLALLRTAVPAKPESRLDSKDELLHLVADSRGVLTPDEQALVVNGLGFGDRRVSEIMTPRSVIDSIKRSELLGPLVLDDLHKTGHSRFPVIHGDIDHVVGILHVRDMLTLDTSKKHTAKVETAMEPRVFYIREDQTLAHALAAFLRTHHHLFIVVNEFRETVGLLSLEDVMEALLGRKIIDEFDSHEDLRAVAARNPRNNNEAKHSENV